MYAYIAFASQHLNGLGDLFEEVIARPEDTYIGLLWLVLDFLTASLDAAREL